MGQLKSFDYKSPYFYMVTLKRRDELQAFSDIGPNGIIENEITRAFNAIIRGFHLTWKCCAEISPFIIMPDHIHLLIKIRDIPTRVSLGVLVSQLSKALRNAYWQIVAPDGATCKTPGLAKGTADFAGGASAPPLGRSGNPPPAIFEPTWHDWIVKRQGQLATFRRYIQENATRAWLRHQNAQFFGQVTRINFLGREWFAYGNRAILALPILVPIKGHRATTKGSRDWRTQLEAASRIGPGGAGVSTFMSPLEKECGNTIFKAGGKLVMLCPEGFGPRWHPTREKERLCAAGRMLFLSLYDACTKQPSHQELYTRCHEMIDLALSGLTPSK